MATVLSGLAKDHNVAEQDVASGASRKLWPLQKGFDRFYGFIGGETNQWYPDLVEDNHFIEPPYGPEKGYHLSKDLADHAIATNSRDQQATNPSRPWYMWYNPGANHAPHQAPREYIAKYKGKFDDGYDAYRTWVLARMIDKGVLPTGTQLTPFNPLPEDVANKADYVRPWNSLNSDEKKLFSYGESMPGSPNIQTSKLGELSIILKVANSENTIISTRRTTALPERAHPTVRSTKTNSSTVTRTISRRTCRP